MLNKLAQEQQAAAGDRLHKFYLPNCHKNGMYHSKQVRVPGAAPQPCQALPSSNVLSSSRDAPRRVPGGEVRPSGSRSPQPLGDTTLAHGALGWACHLTAPAGGASQAPPFLDLSVSLASGGEETALFSIYLSVSYFSPVMKGKGLYDETQ